jgi:hypothetical protein
LTATKGTKGRNPSAILLRNAQFLTPRKSRSALGALKPKESERDVDDNEKGPRLMANDDFYKPNRPPPPARQPKPGEPVWEVRVDHVTGSCEFRFHGESYGWEAQILRNGELFAGQRFVLRELAQEWAEAERQILKKGGA